MDRPPGHSRIPGTEGPSRLFWLVFQPAELFFCFVLPEATCLRFLTCIVSPLVATPVWAGIHRVRHGISGSGQQGCGL